MTLSYEEATKEWAAQTLAIDTDMVFRVEFATSFDGCDTCGYGQGTEATVWLTDGSRRYASIYDVGDVIKEVLNIASTGSLGNARVDMSRAVWTVEPT